MKAGPGFDAPLDAIVLLACVVYLAIAIAYAKRRK